MSGPLALPCGVPYVRAEKMRGFTILVLWVGLVACQGSRGDNASSGSGSPWPSSTGSASRPGREQISPPFDLKAPPGDATTTSSGLIYKKLVQRDAGEQPRRNDTVLINYTGWRQSTGETFFTNRGRGQPMPLNLSQAAPGFIEALPLLRKGEKAVLWMPPSIGYKTPPQGTPETLVYEVELVDITPAPAIPGDVAKPPGNASASRSGFKFVVARPGTGKDKVRLYDNVTFHYTAWAPDGRMLESTEARKSPATATPYKQPVALSEMLTQMVAGQRLRFWAEAQKMKHEGKAPGGVEHGLLCYELEVVSFTKATHEPPPAPPDVAKPPENATKTARGVWYRVLKAGPGKDPRHPAPRDTVKVHYTGWTTDGQMFDSSLVRGEPASFGLQGVIAGWTDGIPVMRIGDSVRFWIPQDLAYKGAPGKPAGMLVFDVELLEITPPGAH